MGIQYFAILSFSSRFRVTLSESSKEVVKKLIKPGQMLWKGTVCRLHGGG